MSEYKWMLNIVNIDHNNWIYTYFLFYSLAFEKDNFILCVNKKIVIMDVLIKLPCHECTLQSGRLTNIVL